MTPDATLILLGRVCALKPAVYGQLFEESCVVNRIERQAASKDNGWTKKMVADPQVMYWYDDLNGEKYFCCFSGYASRIERTLKDRGLQVAVESRISTGLGAPDMAYLKTVEWRKDQPQVMGQILAQLGGVIKCPMGFGKTFIMKQVARAFPTATIGIIATQTDVTNPIYVDLVSSLGSQVGMVGGGKSKLARVTVAVAKSMHKLRKDTNLILADEAHELCTKAYVSELGKFRNAKMIAFTATPEGRSDRADGFLEAVFGPLLIDLSYQRGVENENVVPIHVEIYDVNGADCDINGRKYDNIENDALFDRETSWTNANRNRRIADVVNRVCAEVGDDQQVLVMVDKTEHAYALGQLLPNFAIVTGEPDLERIAEMEKRGSKLPTQPLCTAEQRQNYRVQFEKNVLKRALATKIWRQGVDFKELAVLVRADATANSIQSNQIPGRLSRLNADRTKSHGRLIDFRDRFSRRLLSRFESRLKAYRANGWSVVYKQ